MPLYITTLFSAGVGPVPEENFPYRGSSGLTEKQYYEAHPDEGKAFVSAYYGKNFLQGHTMEEAVAHPNEEPYKSFLDNKIYGEGYLSRDNPLTLDALEDACLRRYLAIQATTNCYTKLDDWSIPALDASGEPSCPVPEIEPGTSIGIGTRHSIYPAYGFFLRHADNVKFDNVRVRPRGLYKRSLVVTDDCTEIDLSGLRNLPPK